MLPTYRALRAFGRILVSGRHELRIRLQPGDVMCFDNYRVLHGRAEFDPNSGPRHLQGCYVDRELPEPPPHARLKRRPGCRSPSLLIDRLPAMSTTVRVSTTTRDRLAAMAETAGRPMTSIIDEALDALERRQFFAALNLRYCQLRDDAEQWSSIEAERAEESAVLHDAQT